jgi:hypothetical protein
VQIPVPRLSLSDLAAGGELLLSLFATELAELGSSVPTKQFVTPGSGEQGIVWDGEQLNVALQDLRQGQPGSILGGTMHPATVVFAAQWAIVLLRAIPILSGNTTGRASIPTAAKIDQAGQENLNDVAAMAQAAANIHALYVTNLPGTGFSIDEVAPMGPGAGLVGVRCLITTSLT